MAEYKVEVERPGCDKCGIGATYSIVNSEEVAESTVYDDKEIAEDLAEMLNAAFERGKQSIPR